MQPSGMIHRLLVSTCKTLSSIKKYARWRVTVFKKIDDGHAALARELAQDLGFTNYAYCSWSLKHDNDGFVLYEKADAADTFAQDHLLDGLSLLSFCPVFNKGCKPGKLLSCQISQCGATAR